MATLLVPVINTIIDTYGWRAAYRAQAMLVAVGGVAVVLLLSRHRARAALPHPDPDDAPVLPPMRERLIAIARQPVFVFLALGILLCKVPDVLASSQLKFVLVEKGASSALAASLIALFMLSVIGGRLVTGYALDCVPPHRVAFVVVMLPAAGLLSLVAPASGTWMLAMAIILLGFAQGAEGDVGAVLVARKFGYQEYSFVYGLTVAVTSLGLAASSLILSASLSLTEKFDAFLVVAAAAVGFAAISFLMTGRYPDLAAPREPELGSNPDLERPVSRPERERAHQ